MKNKAEILIITFIGCMAGFYILTKVSESHRFPSIEIETIKQNYDTECVIVKTKNSVAISCYTTKGE